MRVDCISECSVGVSQACGALRFKAVSDMKSLGTAFHSDLPRRIDVMLDVMKVVFFPSRVKHDWRFKCRERMSLWAHCRHEITQTWLLSSVTSLLPSPSLLREEKWESGLPSSKKVGVEKSKIHASTVKAACLSERSLSGTHTNAML